ncbi:MAG: M13 family metallopeptidase [Bacteroidales bacterium]|nr:M13 family metallopeptidase [Bacteroidales bacterium]MDD4385667.1 M13 family metallopeptidase [Bacteroidales bacterium]MDY0196758.1 M13 family metallopeptidase [Tenuifilaceae bacterium]
MRIKLIILTMILAFFSACKTHTEQKKPALDISNMDLSVNPGDDFYSYANGTWIKNTIIPEDKSRYGSFDILQEENNTILKEIFEKAASKKSAAKGSSWQKVGDFFTSGMNTEAIELKGIEPIRKELDQISALSTTVELQNLIAQLHSNRISPLFNIYAAQDRKNTTKIVVNLSQGGLGLPDRDYYTSDDDKSKVLRNEYQLHIKQIFNLLGYDEEHAKQSTAEVMGIETRLANASFTRIERRDPNKTYNMISIQEMQLTSPLFNWAEYFSGIGIEVPSEFVIDNPKFFGEVSKMLSETPLDNWKSYLTWNVINRFSPYLSSSFVDQQFNFYGKVLSGSEVNKPRWERVAGSANMAIGELVGQIYVEENFSPEAKDKMVELVSNLKAVYRDRMQNLEWMSETTKERAVAKLDAMNVKVGYPDKWKDYSDYEVTPDCYATNIKNALNFGFRQNMDKLGKPVDRTEWFMTPQTVNAYYSPTMNEIVFPAAILQPPFFNLYADDAVNYGAIGVVIGHEMTHGFDDQGRKYNKDGNLEEWWEAEDSDKFNELTQTIIDQYEAFVAIDDMHLSGNLTLGENIADYGGLTISYHALQKSFETNKRPANIDNFTPEQRFFLSYANVWRQVIRDQELTRRVKDDPHSPGRFRVNGALFNINEFYTAFNIKETDPLYRTPEVRPTIW